MAEYPSLPLFTDAFIADTVHLNAAQTGAYLMLLMCAWRTKTCRLPDDDKILARYARMSLKGWLANKDVIMDFWHKDEDGNFYQKRLVDERKFANHKRDQAAKAGKASALKRKERHLTDVPTKRQPKSNHPTPTPTLDTNVSYYDDFERFWASYPDQGPEGARGSAYKGSKKNAKEKFINLAKKEKDYEAFIGNLRTGLKNYREFLRKNPRQQTKHAFTWLKQHGWKEDYTLSSSPSTGNGRNSRNSLEDAVNQALGDQTRRPECYSERLKALGLDDD